MGLLYGRAGRLTAENAGFRPGQRALSPAEVDALYKVEYRSGGGMTNVYSAGAPDPNALPAGCVGFWPLDGSGADLMGGNHASANGEDWVKGLFGLAFRFNGDDNLRATKCDGQAAWDLDVDQVLMIAWVRPTSYDLVYNADTSTIMNKENSYEFGLIRRGPSVIIPPIFSCV